MFFFEISEIKYSESVSELTNYPAKTGKGRKDFCLRINIFLITKLLTEKTVL